MQHGDHLPRVRAEVSGADTILEMTSKKLGLTTVVDAKGSLYGIVTDGDLRDASFKPAGTSAGSRPATWPAAIRKPSARMNWLRRPSPDGTFSSRLRGHRTESPCWVDSLHDLLKHGIVKEPASSETGERDHGRELERSRTGVDAVGRAGK